MDLRDSIRLVSLPAVLVLPAYQQISVINSRNVFGPPDAELGLGFAAKVLCSTVFITGLDVDYALDTSIAPLGRIV